MLVIKSSSENVVVVYSSFVCFFVWQQLKKLPEKLKTTRD